MNVQNYKVVELVCKLDKTVVKNLKASLLAPVSSTTPQQKAVLRILFNLLESESKLSACKIDVFGLDKKRIDDLMNKLLVQVEDYLLSIDSKKLESTEKLYQLLRLYSELQLNRHYQAVITKVRNIGKEKLQIISAEENKSYYLLLKTTEIHEKIRLGRSEGYMEINYLTYFEISYFIEKLKICCELINRNKILDGTLHQGYIEEQVKQSEKYRKHNILIQIYGDLIEILLRSDRISDTEFNNIFDQYKSLPFNDALYGDNVSIANYLINICLRELKADNTEVAMLLLNVIDFMKLKSLILEQGIISGALIKSVVSSAIKLNQLNWAERFFDAYKDFLCDSVRVELVAYLEALFLVKKDKFSEAWERISRVNTKSMDALMKINFIVLEMQIAVELKIGGPMKNKEYLKAISNRLIYILKSKQIGKTNRLKTLNFIKYVHLIKKDKSASQYNSNLKKLEAEKPITQKGWLIKKFKEKTAT